MHAKYWNFAVCNGQISVHLSIQLSHATTEMAEPIIV